MARRTTPEATLASYITGFILSLVMTLAAYLLVTHRNYSNVVIITAIITLALVQFFVQLFFFLHLGKETRPRWKLLVFGFMTTTVFIIVFGSLWIMSNLNGRMMNEQQINAYMDNQDGL